MLTIILMSGRAASTGSTQPPKPSKSAATEKNAANHSDSEDDVISSQPQDIGDPPEPQPPEPQPHQQQQPQPPEPHPDQQPQPQPQFIMEHAENTEQQGLPEDADMPDVEGHTDAATQTVTNKRDREADTDEPEDGKRAGRPRSNARAVVQLSKLNNALTCIINALAIVKTAIRNPVPPVYLSTVYAAFRKELYSSRLKQVADFIKSYVNTVLSCVDSRAGAKPLSPTFTFEILLEDLRRELPAVIDSLRQEAGKGAESWTYSYVDQQSERDMTAELIAAGVKYDPVGSMYDVPTQEGALEVRAMAKDYEEKIWVTVSNVSALCLTPLRQWPDRECSLGSADMVWWKYASSQVSTRPLDYTTWWTIACSFSTMQLNDAIVAVDDHPDNRDITPFGRWLLQSPEHLVAYLTHPDITPVEVRILHINYLPFIFVTYSPFAIGVMLHIFTFIIVYADSEQVAQQRSSSTITIPLISQPSQSP
jgi:hypothetical protein